MGATVYFVGQYASVTLAVLIAIALRMLVTGAIHEDGLTDFFDGFGGGGNDRQRILDIMKDSRIGTYGVLGLGMYLALFVASMTSTEPSLLALMMVAADPFCKMLSAQIIMFLPYARNEEEAKAIDDIQKGILENADGTIEKVVNAITITTKDIEHYKPFLEYVLLPTDKKEQYFTVKTNDFVVLAEVGDVVTTPQEFQNLQKMNSLKN